ncbi:MAG: class C sortase [Candidatus Microbacterium phytovorans]|uniref:Class C sortase n=1 Tax=Candidatus Microbacterium phytovorans TaxID=3121374 RepID=A0AAJ5W323_9MICO|nr:class C sortase [Microbacterium sp.]WEK13440.1 MAG: class C sortase [Microbacterium sp.]
MTLTAQPPPPARTRAAARAARVRRRFSVAHGVAAVVLVLGAGTMLYPSAAAWFSDRAHATEVSGYVSDVDAAGDSALTRAVDAAQDYNARLPEGPLRDPFLLTSDGTAASVEEGRDEYLSLLRFGDSPTMARLRIPEIGVDLPIAHGTDADTLARGVGHLYGSSLPVGGRGSHAVLSGHSGLPEATLFTHLNELEAGDTFAIDVAGRTLTYRIDQILTVDPRDGDALRRVPGRDYVTLLTCTPIGVNTHRLLVRGERVADARGDTAARALAPQAADPGLPWWALGAAAALSVGTAVAWPRRTRADALAPAHGDRPGE